jgi:hypothetical protein
MSGRMNEQLIARTDDGESGTFAARHGLEGRRRGLPIGDDLLAVVLD